MHSAEYNKPQVMKYLALTFGIAYIMQAGIAFLYRNGNAGIGQILMTVMMYVPALGVLLSGGKPSGMEWKRLQIRKNFKTILIAWFTPAILTVIGAALYFLVFPGQFDLTGSYLTSVAGKEALEQIEAQGLTYSAYVLGSALACITYAPLINSVFAFGEEVGWRAFLYPQLKAKYGRQKGLLLGGVIWGAWHWPLIWLIGYEYGMVYFGYPVVGMLLFCVFTIGTGILCDWLYERSGNIWMPSIFHGAINAAATVPLAVCSVLSGSTRLLGPAPNGLIAGLPILVAAVLVLRFSATGPQR